MLYNLVHPCLITLADPETLSRSLPKRGGKGPEERNVEFFKDFWQVCASALGDWPKMTRMCVLITVISLNWSMIHWLLRH